MPIAAERRSTGCDPRQGVSFNVSLGATGRRTGRPGAVSIIQWEILDSKGNVYRRHESGSRI